MRRHLDPSELEALVHDNEVPARTPFDLMVDIVWALLGAVALATLALAFIAYALSKLPGTSP